MGLLREFRPQESSAPHDSMVRGWSELLTRGAPFSQARNRAQDEAAASNPASHSLRRQVSEAQMSPAEQGEAEGLKAEAFEIHDADRCSTVRGHHPIGVSEGSRRAHRQHGSKDRALRIAGAGLAAFALTVLAASSFQTGPDSGFRPVTMAVRGMSQMAIADALAGSLAKDVAKAVEKDVQRKARTSTAVQAQHHAGIGRRPGNIALNNRKAVHLPGSREAVNRMVKGRHVLPMEMRAGAWHLGASSQVLAAKPAGINGTNAEGNATERGRDGEDIEDSVSAVGLPESDLPAGLAGSDTAFVKAVDAFLADLQSPWNDEAVKQQKQAEEGHMNYFPFGRDEVVPQVRGPPPVPDKSIMQGDTFSDFPDRIGPDNDASAISGQDVYVPLSQTVAGMALATMTNSTTAVQQKVQSETDDSPLLKLLKDDFVAQPRPQQIQPKVHHVHSDFDFQGMLPDVVIDKSHYLPSLGEDTHPFGIFDEMTSYGAPVKASPPRPVSENVVPSNWNDEYVTPGATGQILTANLELERAKADLSSWDLLGGLHDLEAGVTDEFRDGKGDFLDQQRNQTGTGFYSEKPLLPFLGSKP